jgi:putative endonuclease
LSLVFVFAVASVLAVALAAILFFNRNLLPQGAAAVYKEYEFFVYILASKSRNLYIGITNNLRLRLQQHKEGKAGSFTARYSINRLVYFERFCYINHAIAREKELKDWRRELKVALIEGTNPTWEDLSEDKQTADSSASLRNDKILTNCLGFTIVARSAPSAVRAAPTADSVSAASAA